MASMWVRVRRMLEMIRFSHTIFALPFALMATVMAWRVPTASGEMLVLRPRDLLGILVCMVCARSAAMAFNRVVDKDLDSRNPRTSTRHLPAGLLSVPSVVMFTCVTASGFVLGTLLFLPNRLPLLLSLPVLAFLGGYSYAKRFTALAHVWLGAALMLAPVSAWIAVRGAAVMEDPLDLLPAGVVGLAVLAWVTGFDMIYACQDVDFDVASRLHSAPVRHGVPATLRMAAASHFVMVVILCGLPFVGQVGGPPLELGGIYWLSLAAVALLLLYEHSLVRPDDLSRVNLAFFHVNALISIGLFLVVTLELFL